MAEHVGEHEAWPARAAILAAAGALFGLAISQLFDDFRPEAMANLWRGGAAVFLLTGGIVASFTLERTRWAWSLAFAAAAGLVLAFVYHWNGGPNGWSGSEGWRFVSAALTVVIAAPLFQTIRDEGQARLPYPSVHIHAWTNIVLWVLACGFTLLVWLMMWLVAALFDLIGIGFINDLMRNDWFGWMLAGAAFGCVMGLLRDRDQVLFLVQRVAMTILSVLAPILAAALLLFLLSLLFKGLAPLWDTQSATSILLTCVLGAILLANAVIGNVPEEESKARVMRWSATALAGAILPLTLIAAVSTGKRIAQYGFTPSRLWALTFVIVATICAVAYAVSLLRGRKDWPGLIRPANVRLAVIVCAVAFLLATPLVSFGAISTRDQVARLASGKVSIEQFDWRALRFDFGPSGMRALRRLAQEGATPEIRKRAAEVIAEKDRWEMAVPVLPEVTKEQNAALARWQVLPRPVALPPELREAMRLISYCNENDRCRIYYEEGEETAVAVRQSICAPPPDQAGTVSEDVCAPEVRPFYKSGDAWRVDEPLPATVGNPVQRTEQIKRAMDEGRVTIRDVTRRQVFVGEVSVGKAFE
ncbi:DUF4153 domain-containing protein [Allosphingosinicella vermicomposti]|uniref:DUF4153 domain-containing protein n=1 Tax=Allosphingosinicella vermicomposti TaxID=614671 RepID=UPI000D10533B|nr:DUF4153 domain-containing protein [Allosphingosinicella vermicomposti]